VSFAVRPVDCRRAEFVLRLSVFMVAIALAPTVLPAAWRANLALNATHRD
jgi:hypothetical protein